MLACRIAHLNWLNRIIAFDVCDLMRLNKHCNRCRVKLPTGKLVRDDLFDSQWSSQWSLAAKAIRFSQREARSTVYNQIFFTNVLRLLDERGITKNELSDAAGMSVSFLSDLTNGKANPSLKIMESIANALEVPLPALLEVTDLDRDTLHLLAGGKPLSSLPEGLVRVTAVLTEYEAFTVQQWDEANRNRLSVPKPNKT